MAPTDSNYASLLSSVIVQRMNFQGSCCEYDFSCCFLDGNAYIKFETFVAVSFQMFKLTKRNLMQLT